MPEMKRIYLSVVTLCLLVGCADDDISARISAEFDSGASPIDLAAVGPERWDRVCVLGPYTDNKRTAKVLGFAWNSELRTSIAGSDSVTVLIFVEGKRVTAYTEHPRVKGDFGRLSSRCLPRSSAVVFL